MSLVFHKTNVCSVRFILLRRVNRPVMPAYLAVNVALKKGPMKGSINKKFNARESHGIAACSAPFADRRIYIQNKQNTEGLLQNFYKKIF